MGRLSLKVVLGGPCAQPRDWTSAETGVSSDCRRSPTSGLGQPRPAGCLLALGLVG